MEKEKKEAPETKNTEGREVWTDNFLMSELSQTTSESKGEKADKEEENESRE